MIVRRVINPIIPVSFIGTVALLATVSGDNPLKYILSGGLMLGAIFMATDYVTSPTANWGKLIFGIGCGAITFVIRRFGSLPEGVSYGILIMNIITPLINRITPTIIRLIDIIARIPIDTSAYPFGEYNNNKSHLESGVMIATNTQRANGIARVRN